MHVCPRHACHHVSAGCGTSASHSCCTAQIPFVKRAPLVTFRKPIGSVSVSGHKFIGAPVPCGVVITRQRYVEALSRRAPKRQCTPWLHTHLDHSCTPLPWRMQRDVLAVSDLGRCWTLLSKACLGCAVMWST